MFCSEYHGKGESEGLENMMVLNHSLGKAKKKKKKNIVVNSLIVGKICTA